MPTLGEELRRLRELKGYSLRAVEHKTKKKISNSYLYQLESGAVKEPSPNILYELAQAYGVSYKSLMELAGYVFPVSKEDRARGHASVAFSALGDLTEEEEERVLDFVEFMRHKRRAR